MSFPKYPEYKDSGIEWLGEVPAHWVVGPLRWYATIQGGVAKGKSYSDGTPTVDLPYLRVANVQDGHVDLSSVNTVTVALSEVGRYRLQPGDVLMNEGGDNDKLGRGTVWQGKIADCLHQNHVFAIRPNHHLLPYWLSMFTRSSAARSYFYLYSKQSTNLASISSSNVMSCPLPIPPQEEQRQVLRFLDHETARIDALVEQQKRLIELLKEKRQAVISHAVTKGLEPDVPMKDSGVEWLGEVPAHWEVKSLMHLTPPDRKIMYGIVLPGPDFDGGVPIIKGGDVKPGRLSLDKLCRTDPEIEAKYERSRVDCGDIVYSIRGGIGDAEIVPEEVAGSNLTQDAARVAPRDGVCNVWLLYALKSGPVFAQLEAKATGATIRGINIMDLKRATLPVPPLQEQQHITERLGFIIGKMDRLEKEAGAAITLMQEHRSALISAAVTGKIDVRGWQADQQSEQPEVLMAAEACATYGSGKEKIDEV